MRDKLRAFIKEETVLFILIILFIFLTALMPGYMGQYSSFIDWKTIVTLLALIITATGIKDSGYLGSLAGRVLLKIHDERTLAFFLVFLSVILSAFLTNDITLFIVVPLTLCMQAVLKNDLNKVIIFEAIGVNVGSTLTPIGNPQNIFLWNKWGISFAGFMGSVAPVVLLMAAALVLFILAVFKKHSLSIIEDYVKTAVNAKLGAVSFTIMALFLAALQFKMEMYSLPVIALIYALFYRKVLFGADWLLILTFIFMFIDFSMISRIPFVTELISSIDTSNSRNAFVLSAFLSQVMSNVPAAIFMAKFTHNWKAVTFGVDIAGNGIIIGSLANIIAIRLLKPKGNKAWMDFHKYSVPYFLVTGFIVWLFI